MRNVRFNPIRAIVALSSAALIFGGISTGAQINPQTAKAIAQDGAKAAQSSSAPQSSAPAPAPNKTVTPAQKPAQKTPAPKTQSKPAVKTNTASKTTSAPAKQPAADPSAAKTNAAKANNVKVVEKPAAAAKESPEKPHEVSDRPVYKRDPFSFLVGKTASAPGSTVVLPPGKAGLQVESLMIQGIVSSPEGMIAVVANPQQRVYFLHEGDQLFDGSVVKIGMEAITFHEVGRDAFGKPTEREVTKRLNNSSGELP
ncbi:MAG TPA: hypothetical protein VFO34_05765 [Candidatus Acidoferrales bacterium]|nr:hypothetical protein [Candidatus Acidoferrales bacterium]